MNIPNQIVLYGGATTNSTEVKEGSIVVFIIAILFILLAFKQNNHLEE